MDFRIKKLGPIDEAKLELGDITVLIGPPNVGKSYTLKALYSSLIMLDPVARNSLLKSILAELKVQKHRLFVHEEDTFVFLTNLAILYKIDSQMTKGIAKRIGNVVGKIDIKIENDMIIATSKRTEVLDLKKLVELIQEQNDHLWGVLPTIDGTKINLKLSIPNLFSIIAESFRRPFTVKEENYDQELKLFIGYYISSYLQDAKLILERTAEIRLDVINPMIKKKYSKRELLKLEKAKDTAEILKILYNLRLFKLTPRGWIILRAIPEMVLIEGIQDQLAEKIGEILELVYRRALGIHSALFIPFGRSPLVCQLEYISREPFFRTEILEEYQRFDILLYSYVSKLSIGRAKLSEGNYNKEIVHLFEPVLQGNLVFDKRLGELKYKRWGFEELYRRQEHEGIPIKWASALAGEVTGILLPILAVPHSSYLIIEEPESQLHYSAQVLMALALIGLSSLFGHKIAFSTHSDVLAITLAYIQEFKPSKDKVLELIKKLLEMQNINVDDSYLKPLAEAVSKDVDIDIRFYYYEPTPSGVRIFEKKPSEIIKDVPGITDVVNILATWAMSL